MRRSRNGNPKRHARLKELFLRAIELEEEARSSFIDAACRDDVDLRAEVESLLRHHRPSDLPRSQRD